MLQETWDVRDIAFAAGANLSDLAAWEQNSSVESGHAGMTCGVSVVAVFWFFWGVRRGTMKLHQLAHKDYRF